jgi:hypothetical protein
MIYSGGLGRASNSRTTDPVNSRRRSSSQEFPRELGGEVSDLAKSLAHIEQVRARKMMPANDVSMLSSDTGACAQQYLRERSSPPTIPVKRSDLDAPACLG